MIDLKFDTSPPCRSIPIRRPSRLFRFSHEQNPLAAGIGSKICRRAKPARPDDFRAIDQDRPVAALPNRNARGLKHTLDLLGLGSALRPVLVARPPIAQPQVSRHPVTVKPTSVTIIYVAEIRNRFLFFK